MLCIFQMRSFPKWKLGKLDLCCHYINEKYLLCEIGRMQKMQARVGEDGNFNGEFFIRMNQLYRDFNQQIEWLSFNVSSFWKSLSSAHSFEVSVL